MCTASGGLHYGVRRSSVEPVHGFMGRSFALSRMRECVYVGRMCRDSVRFARCAPDCRVPPRPYVSRRFFAIRLSKLSMSSETYRFCPKCATELEDWVSEDRVRRRCPSCGFVHYDNPLPVVAAIVELNEDVVLVRNHGWPETWFGLVTGFLEKGESPREGVLREIREEIGLEGTIVSLVGVYPFRRMNQLIVAYHVRCQGEPEAGPEIAAIKRVPIAKLRPWPFGTGHAVKEWLATRQRNDDRQA